jgi:hypothetical protein
MISDVAAPYAMAANPRESLRQSFYTSLLFIFFALLQVPGQKQSLMPNSASIAWNMSDFLCGESFL